MRRQSFGTHVLHSRQQVAVRETAPRGRDGAIMDFEIVGEIRDAETTTTGLAMKSSTGPATQFAVCINNEGYKAALEVGKLYRVVPDEDAASHGYIRVIDESGEDYGYAATRFFQLEVPQELANALLTAA